MRGTIKAAVLEGDPKCPDVIVLSFYDSKDVYFMSTSCTTMKWIEKELKNYDKEQQKMVSMKFYCHEIVNDYNYGINIVDRADQIRSSYRFDPWT